MSRRRFVEILVADDCAIVKVVNTFLAESPEQCKNIAQTSPGKPHGGDRGHQHWNSYAGHMPEHFPNGIRPGSDKVPNRAYTEGGKPQHAPAKEPAGDPFVARRKVLVEIKDAGEDSLFFEGEIGHGRSPTSVVILAY